MKTLTCTCCGADITAPQFHNGKPYGYTCILKVAPEQKQVKVKFYPVEMIASRKAPIGQAYTVTFKFNGKKHIAHVQQSCMVEQDGVLFLSEHVFKNIK